VDDGGGSGDVTDVLAGTGISVTNPGGPQPTVSLSTPVAVGNGGTGTTTAFTAGSVVFAGASGVYSQDNSNLFWDDTNNRLGIGTSTPSNALQVVGTARASGFSGPDGTAGSPSYYFTNDTNSGMYSGGADTLSFSTGGTSRMNIDSGGTVNVAGGVTWGTTGALNTDQGGSIELGSSTTVGVTPFIDFHYGTGSAQDYNTRIINDANGQLSMQGGDFNISGGGLKGVTDSYAETDGSVSNTSNASYVNATSITVANAGTYILFASVEGGCSGCYCQARLRQTSGTPVTLGGDVHLEDMYSDGIYAPASWTKRVTVTAGTAIAIQQKLEPGDSGTCYTRNARIFALRVD
jgi:hypothetical protein